MSTISNKHKNAQRIFYPSFDGGLNLSVPPESLARNELKEAVNVEFSPTTGAMTVRGGLVWSGSFGGEIDSVATMPGRRGFLVRRKGTKKAEYSRWNTLKEVSGELSGYGELSVVAWDDGYLVASGGKLQRLNDRGIPTLETLDDSPDECRLVFVRDGRAGIVSGDSEIRFSAVGDCTSWENVPNDDSSGQYVEIGYKDGMRIDAVIPLSRDLIVFKSPPYEPDKGTIYRLTGIYPDWAVIEVAHNTGTFSPRSVQAVGNDVYYITVSGLASLSAVTSYGEIQATWPDRKVSPALSQIIETTAELWNVPVKQQLWIITAKGNKTIWIYDYMRGIWTTFEFPKPPLFASGLENSVYVFIGEDIYRIQDWYTEDELKDDGKQRITASMRMGTLIAGKQLLVKGAFATFGIYPGCRAELHVEGFVMPFTVAGKADYIYDAPNDTQYASEDDDPIYPEKKTLTARRQCIVRGWSVTPEVKIEGGGCSLSTMGLEIVEVW